MSKLLSYYYPRITTFPYRTMEDQSVYKGRPQIHLVFVVVVTVRGGGVAWGERQDLIAIIGRVEREIITEITKIFEKFLVGTGNQSGFTPCA